MLIRPFYEMVVLTVIMGFSIYLSFPIILRKNINERSTIILSSFAVGILIFLIADIFSDAASQLYPVGSYQANPILSILFAISITGLFTALYLLESLGKISKPKGGYAPMRIAFLVAVGMGLQNLTEGLVFGSTYVLGITGLSLLILVGFILQNFTEGFPIISPFIGEDRPKLSIVAILYFIGGFPTIAGSLIGYYYVSPYLNLLFDGFAIGAIVYVIIPMLKNLFRQAEYSRLQPAIYIGIILGFIVGFGVNSI